MPALHKRRAPAAEAAPQSQVIVPDSIVRNTVTSLISHAFTAGLTAVLTLFLVRALDPTGYGLFALATSVSSIVLIAADFGISGSTSRFAAEQRDHRDEVGRLYVDALKLKILVTGGVCLLLALLAGVIANAYGEPDLAWPLRLIAIATFAQSIFLMGMFNALGQSRMRVRVAGTEAVTEVGASIALVLLGGGVVGATLGRAIGYAVGALLGVVLLLRLLGYPRLRPLRPPRRATVRRVGRYASGLLVVDTAYVLAGNANILLLGAYLGSAASGIYQAPGRLIILLQYPGMSLTTGVAPRMARRPGRAPDVHALSSALRLLIIYQATLVAPVVLWGEPIVTLLLGEEYREAGTVFSVMAPYVLFSGLAPLLSVSANFFGAARKRIPIALATLVLTVITSVTLIPRFGLVGAAVGTNINFGFYTLAHLVLAQRVMHLPLRPVAWTTASGLTAAGAMALVLSRFDAESLTIPELIGGGLAGLVAYAAVLVFTQEVTVAELRQLRRFARRRSGGGAPPASAVSAVGAQAADAPTRGGDEVAEPVHAQPAPPGGAVVHEITWRATEGGGAFELRPLDGDGAGDGASRATSDVLDWRWSAAPGPIPDARAVHGALVDGLLRQGWEPHGWGERWYATRLLPPLGSDGD